MGSILSGYRRQQYVQLEVESQTKVDSTKECNMESYTVTCFIILAAVAALSLIAFAVVVARSSYYQNMRRVKGRIFVNINIEQPKTRNIWRTDELGAIVHGQYPWIVGSKYELIPQNNETNVWKVKSLKNGKFVIVDPVTRALKTGPSYSRDALFLHVDDIVFADDWTEALVTSSIGLGTDNDTVSAAGVAKPFNIRIRKIPFIYGVNLGSWFIPERWMTPTIYHGVDTYWSQVCGLVHELGPTEADNRMLQHIDSWVTEKDLDKLKDDGINSLRIPLGYWNIIPDPFKKFAPVNVSDSEKYIDWIFLEAKKRSMTIMLDLHGAPGGQNSYEHCGCGYDAAGGVTWTLDVNQELTLKALERLVTRYSRYDNLLGIEVLNEPGLEVESNHIDVLKAFYKKAYKTIRQHNEKVIIVFNELWSQYYWVWADEFLEPDYHNVVFDWHLYSFFAPTLDSATSDFDRWITSYPAEHPLMIGEWSCSDKSYFSIEEKLAFVDAQLKAFSQAWGWYYWNFKVSENAPATWALDNVAHMGMNFTKY